jgi:hypothetical protein
MYNTITHIAEVGPISQDHVKTLLFPLNYNYYSATRELIKTKKTCRFIIFVVGIRTVRFQSGNAL